MTHTVFKKGETVRKRRRRKGTLETLLFVLLQKTRTWWVVWEERRDMERGGWGGRGGIRVMKGKSWRDVMISSMDWE